MTRYIDADALIPMMKYATTDSEIGVFPIKIGFNAITEVINNAPTVEAIPISFIEEQVKLCSEIGFRRGEECNVALIEKWREKNGTDVD